MSESQDIHSYTPGEAPRHIVIIMDGNGRWARQRGLPRYIGHRGGMESVRRIVEAAIDQKVSAVSLFAFSRENWRRPAEEVDQIMRLFFFALKREVRKLHKNGVRLRIIGERSEFSPKLIAAVEKAEALTKNNTKLDLVIAANYGGRWDLIQAARELARQVKEGALDAGSIDSSLIHQQLTLSDLPEPDLFIRTGGEQRISNYFLWQLAYTELYFTDVLWPDFRGPQLSEAIEWFKQRQRRFGRTGEQVERGSNV